MAATYQYKYISGFTFYNDGTPSGIEVWVEALGVDLPDFKRSYSLAVYETEAKAEAAIKNELDTLGVFENGHKYPTTGTPLPGQEPSSDPPTPDPGVENNTEESTIEYFINNDPILVEKDSKGKKIVPLYEYTVSNNIELPNAIKIFSAAMKGYGNFGYPALDYAKSIEWTWDYSKNQLYGGEPYKLKTLIFENQSRKILNQFYKSSWNKIPGKSYKNQNYPIGGTLKSLYNQDPIAYTFSSIIVNKTSQELLSGVKIKDLEGQNTTSNPDGSFDITGTFSPGKVQKLTFNLKKYGVETQIITTLNGSIRSDINVIELTTDKEIKSTILKSRGTTEKEKKKLTKEEKADFAKATAKKIIEEIKIRLIPFLIKKLLCEPYGVCDPIGLIEKAKEAKEKAKDLNERRKEKKAKKEAEKELAEEAEQNSIDEEN